MRVLVLRAADQAKATAARLGSLGHDPLVAPILTIETTAEPRPPGAFAAILATSANALPALRSLQAEAAGLPVFAVGRQIGAALAGAGFSDIATESDAVSLAQLVADRMPPARLLLVAGRDRKREPEASLTRAGFTIAVWEAYEAVTADRLPSAAVRELTDGRLDMVLHYSRRSAEAARLLAREAGVEREFAGLRHACLSPDVAEGLDGIPAGRIHVAASPDEEALLGLLDRSKGSWKQAHAPRS